MKADAQRGGASGMNLEMLQAFEKNFPPEAVAPMVVWLCTDEAKDVNGRTFLLAGKQIALYSEPEIIKSATTDQDLWTVDSVSQVIPKEVTAGLTNQWPGQPPKEG